MSYQSNISEDEIKSIVQKNYGKIAEGYLKPKNIEHTPNHEACCVTTDDCCAPSTLSLEILTSDSFIPSFGCDSELLSIANPKEGEIVVDLGSGPGRDALTAAKLVGSSGKVLGIDMTDEMLDLARKNAKDQKINNTKFIKSDITAIPLDENSIDLIISNCVVNLVPNKEDVFTESYRILKPGGRFVIADMITLTDLKSDQMTSDMFCACIGGATSEQEYKDMMIKSGFRDVDYIRRNTTTTSSNDLEIKYASTIFIGYK